jgi:molybdopterin-containing oxidoreductase family membrane subunit
VSFFSLGWNGSYRTWLHYEIVYLLLAGLATPLVVSVHTIVSWDFATSVIPGWHAMAMVLTLMIIARKVMHLESYITHRHVDVMSKLILATSGIVGLAYATEFFTALYSGNPYESYVFFNRAAGPLFWAYWTMVSCNVLVPLLLWFKRVRQSIPVVFVITLLVNVGMWFERFVIIVTSLERDYLPSSWASYKPTSVEIATFVGSFGLFFTLFLLFCRFLPVIAMAEVKTVLRFGKPPLATVPPGHEPVRAPVEEGVHA